jgi:hypothetical protein
VLLQCAAGSSCTSGYCNAVSGSIVLASPYPADGSGGVTSFACGSTAKSKNMTWATICCVEPAAAPVVGETALVVALDKTAPVVAATDEAAPEAATDETLVAPT